MLTICSCSPAPSAPEPPASPAITTQLQSCRAQEKQTLSDAVGLSRLSVCQNNSSIAYCHVANTDEVSTTVLIHAHINVDGSLANVCLAEQRCSRICRAGSPLALARSSPPGHDVDQHTAVRLILTIFVTICYDGLVTIGALCRAKGSEDPCKCLQLCALGNLLPSCLQL